MSLGFSIFKGQIIDNLFTENYVSGIIRVYTNIESQLKMNII